MPQIRLYGLANVIRRLQKGLENAGIDIPARYAEAVEQLSAAVVKDARSALAKPNWELSKAMTAHSTKLYQNGRIVFKVVEVVGSAANPPEKNTPAAFVHYQEHGYYVPIHTVRRPRSGRTVMRGQKANAYQRAEGKKFFEAAYLANEAKLKPMIEEINRSVEEYLSEQGIRTGRGRR